MAWAKKKKEAWGVKKNLNCEEVVDPFIKARHGSP
jgi:hypothetical protein